MLSTIDQYITKSTVYVMVYAFLGLVFFGIYLGVGKTNVMDQFLMAGWLYLTLAFMTVMSLVTTYWYWFKAEPHETNVYCLTKMCLGATLMTVMSPLIWFMLIAESLGYRI